MPANTWMNLKWYWNKCLKYNPATAKTKEFYDRVDVSFDWIPMQQEDLQAVMYYAWFKSRMTGDDRYEILQALIKVIG